MENEEMQMVSLPKKVWKIVRVFLYMVRKGICKKKLLMDLNLLLKRGKLAGKAALVNLTLFHHHSIKRTGPREYEFSCSNTPAHPKFLLMPTKKGAFFGGHQEEEMGAINAALQMMMTSGGRHHDMYNYSVEASPLLPGLGFGRSPVVRQLLVTDSPYPLSASEGGDSHVDEAAEEFIKRFYSHLRTQS